MKKNTHVQAEPTIIQPQPYRTRFQVRERGTLFRCLTEMTCVGDVGLTGMDVYLYKQTAMERYFMQVPDKFHV